MRLGVHVSIAGRIYEAVDRAARRGSECMQIFSRNPRGWQVKELDPLDILEFNKRRTSRNIRPLFVHIPYLINLASPYKILWQRSVSAYTQDIKQADILAAEYFVTHLGSHRGKGKAYGLQRFIEGLNLAIEAARPNLTILLENTSGSGNMLGANLDDIQFIIDKIENKDKIGICFDTCHAFAAGYDIRNKKILDETLKKIDLKRLRLIHLNDSKGDLGSHLDRHEHIGKGRIGKEGFRQIINHPKLRDLSFILETPKFRTKFDKMNMKTVRSLYEPR